MRDRRWWLVIVALGIASIPFLADTLIYPRVLLDAQTNPIDGRGGPFYSITEFPLVAIPVVAWLGTRRSLAEEHTPKVPASAERASSA
jgi:hypothetical protein